MTQLHQSMLAVCLALAATAAPLRAEQVLVLNPSLDYNSDSIDGPLITGVGARNGIALGKPNYIMIYGEGCYNSKRQARRTVALAHRYADKVHFVIIDLDKPQTPAEASLVSRFYTGSIPDLVLLDANGRVAYDRAGEQDESVLAGILDRVLLQESH